MKNVAIAEQALYLAKEKTLVISDMHIGMEEAMQKKGFLLPRFQLKDFEERLNRIFLNHAVDIAVFNGDLKHEFGSISATEWRNITSMLEFVGKHAKEIIIIKGNHDILLEPIAKKLNINVRDYYKVNDYFICHGDKLIENLDFDDSKVLIIGNEHAAISLRKGGRKELYKCCLLGKFRDKRLIAMPSFNSMTEGTDILQQEFIGPFLKQDLGNFDVYISSDKTYHFGKVRNVEAL